MCFQYSINDVITPNLGNYRTDMTISSTALNQSKLVNYFQINNIIVFDIYTICMHACFGVYASSVQLCTCVDT